MKWLTSTLWQATPGKRSEPVDEGTRIAAEAIIGEVRNNGNAGLRACIQRFENRDATLLMIPKEALETAFRSLSPEVQGVLRRTGERIRRFAEAQRASIFSSGIPVEGVSQDTVWLLLNARHAMRREAAIPSPPAS